MDKSDQNLSSPALVFFGTKYPASNPIKLSGYSQI